MQKSDRFMPIRFCREVRLSVSIVRGSLSGAACVIIVRAVSSAAVELGSPWTACFRVVILSWRKTAALPILPSG